jgi:hydrogenase 3 maturation protease
MADKKLRIAVIGIGNELNGDDAVGVLLARSLDKKWKRRDDRLVVDAGPSPENFSGTLRSFAPRLVVLVDAADFSGKTGELRWLDWQQADGISATTHTLPLSVFADFIEKELDCQVLLLGIQVGQVGFEAPLSAEALKAVETATEILLNFGIETVSKLKAPLLRGF